MESFLSFIHKTKEAVIDNCSNYESIHVVLGNESSDLDSTVSALTLAYLMYLKNLHNNKQNCIVVPIINVDEKYFSLRTEICYLFNEANINIKDLVFKDHIDYSVLLQKKTIKTTLVDHHVLPEHDKILEETVVEIFDHRPINSKDICKNKDMKTTIKLVGSCTTLIVNEYKNANLQVFCKELFHLLYATIIYDTIGVNKEHGRTFDEDILAVEYLENLIKPTQTRKELFDILWKVHNDTSSLTTKDLLYRDVKVVQGIPIPGLPLLVEDYLKRPDAAYAISSFANEYENHNIVLIGIDASNVVRRDLAIYFTDQELKNEIVETLKRSKEIAGADLELTEVCSNNKNVICFRQGNIKLTRKFILPLVIEAAQALHK